MFHTSGTSGIGYAVAERSANEGASVVVVSSRQEKVDRAISRLSHGTEGYTVDLTNEAQVRQLFIDIGQFDHLVFSAGDPLPPATLSTMDVDAARQLFNLRYWGALMAVKYGSGHMKEGGSITLVSGTAGMRPQKGLTIGASLCGFRRPPRTPRCGASGRGARPLGQGRRGIDGLPVLTYIGAT